MRKLTRLRSWWALTFVDQWQGVTRSLVAVFLSTGGLRGHWGMVSGIECTAEELPWPSSPEAGKDPPEQATGWKPLIKRDTL